jgi:hypothetical protein
VGCPVLDGGADEGGEEVAVWSVTRKFEAIDAAAW